MKEKSCQIFLVITWILVLVVNGLDPDGSGTYGNSDNDQYFKPKIGTFDDEDFSYLCSDNHESCATWSSRGECKSNPRYMKKNCPKSCDVCFEQEESSEFEDSMGTRRGADLGLAQQLVFEDGTREEDIQWIILKTRNYMNQIVPKKFGHGMDKLCRNKSDHCAWWALIGECENNPAYMLSECAPTCGSCEAVEMITKCPLDPKMRDIWQSGDLGRLFQRLTSEPYISSYSVKILSSPENGNPWVISMEDLLSEVEAKRLIELGYLLGYNRSTDVGTVNRDGNLEEETNEGRTSTTAWCNDECYKDNIVKSVLERLTALTEIPETNSEHLQLLRYEIGQEYQVHHDYIPHHRFRQGGPRILTVYLYLNDVEQGGETYFDQLGVTVVPKRGRAVIWPNALDKYPDRQDERTSHQALPVVAGIKFGANASFHLRDFKTALENDCM